MSTADFSSPHHRVYPRDNTHRNVVGYLGQAQPAELRQRLEAAVYAHAEKYGLGTVQAVYRDTGPRDGNLHAGFERCLRDLERGRAHGVIVPRDEAIAADRNARLTLLAWVRAAGGVVYAMEGAPS